MLIAFSNFPSAWLVTECYTQFYSGTVKKKIDRPIQGGGEQNAACEGNQMKHKASKKKQLPVYGATDTSHE